MDPIYIKILNKTNILIVSAICFLTSVLSIAYIVYYIKDKVKNKAKPEDEMKLRNSNNDQVPQSICVQ